MTHNSDLQKFDGMVRMILDLSETQYQHIVNLLEERRERGELIYGIHKTDSALFICMVRKQECHDLTHHWIAIIMCSHVIHVGQGYSIFTYIHRGYDEWLEPLSSQT